jgi:hypothetical protein
MIRWQADPELRALIQRYYAGEAGLWAEIQSRIDAELRRRGAEQGAFHIRLRRLEQGYEVQIEDASAYTNDS